MTDKQAAQLLELLDLYVKLPEYAPGDSDTITIRMLAQDLICSLNVHQIPKHLSTELDEA